MKIFGESGFNARGNVLSLADFRLMTYKKPEVIEDGKLALPAGLVLEYDTCLAYEAEEVDPVGVSSPMDRWGSPVLYRLHFTVRAKEFECKFKYTAK